MTRADRTRMNEAVLTRSRRPQGVKDRHGPLHVDVTAADHQAVALFQTPDAARDTGVDESNALVAQQFCMRTILCVARIAAVYHQVPGA